MKQLSILLFSLLLFSCHQESFDEACRREAIEHTKKYCPQKVSEGVTLDSVTYNIPTRTKTEYYSLSGKLDTTIVAQNTDKFRTALLNTLITSVELRKAKEEGVSFAYSYRSSRTKQEYIHINFTKKDYGHH